MKHSKLHEQNGLGLLKDSPFEPDIKKKNS